MEVGKGTNTAAAIPEGKKKKKKKNGKTEARILNISVLKR